MKIQASSLMLACVAAMCVVINSAPVPACDDEGSLTCLIKKANLLLDQLLERTKPADVESELEERNEDGPIPEYYEEKKTWHNTRVRTPDMDESTSALDKSLREWILDKENNEWIWKEPVAEKRADERDEEKKDSTSALDKSLREWFWENDDWIWKEPVAEKRADERDEEKKDSASALDKSLREWIWENKKWTWKDPIPEKRADERDEEKKGADPIPERALQESEKSTEDLSLRDAIAMLEALRERKHHSDIGHD